MKKKIYEDYMIVDEMYVSAKCRGEGIGRKLYSAYGFVHNENFMQYKL